MKYYHIIYTSTEKNLGGSGGYGIRTATIGTPQDYLDAVSNKVNLFNSIVDDCPVPTSSELKADGKTILNVPPRYFYLSLEINSGKTVYVIGRNVYLGFTQTFYFKDSEGKVSGMGGRMGNYLLDLYFFEEIPPRDAFQIFYEDPAPTSQHFVPKDPSPRTDNIEMIGIATGEPQMLDAKDIPFTANQRNSWSDKVVELLFALIESKLTDKRLVVKYPWRETHQLIGDLIDMLPDNKVGAFTFSTNYTGNGNNVPADVNFANEHYAANYVGRDVFVDLQSATLTTKETEAYKQIVLDAIVRKDVQTIRNLTGWMLSTAYKDVRNMAPHTNRTLYIYTQQPENFNISMLTEDAATSTELMSSLNKLIQENPATNGRTFTKQLEQALVDALNNNGNPQIFEVVRTYRKYIKETASVVNKYESRPELATYFFDVIKENLPKTLQTASQMISYYQSKNLRVVELMASNFQTIFGSLYDTIVLDAAARADKQALASQLDNQLLVPMSEAKNDAAYKKLGELCDILTDNFKVDNYNFQTTLDLLKRVGMTNSKTGMAVKELFFHQVSNIQACVQTLNEVWNVDAKQIIDYVTQLAANNDLDARTQHAYITEALANSGFTLEQVLEIFNNKSFKFSDFEREQFFAKCKKYSSAYKSYNRKKIFSGIFGKILGLFKRKSKDSKEPQQAGSSILHSKSRPRPSVQQQNAKPELISPSQTAYAPKPKLVERPAREFTEAELDQVEIYLQNRGSEVSDTVKENAEEVERRFYESRRKNGIPPELRRFVTYFRGLLLLFGLSFLTPCESLAAGQIDSHIAYGDIKDAPKCYIVSPQTLNVRTSPSLYKGKRKKTKRKDNVGFKLNQGDTIFVSALVQPSTADGVTWISFTHEGTDYYTDITKLTEIDNPRLVRKVSDEKENNADGFLGWLQRSAPTILLVLTGILFLLWILGILASADSWKDYFRAEVRDDTKMRPMFMYSLQPYKSAASVSLALLICFAASIIIMLAIGGVVWGFLWIVKLLVWGLIIIGWICLIVGVICIFVNWAVAIPCLIIGGLIYHYQESLESFGNACVATGMAFFDAINVWEFSRDLVQHYWQHALVISLAPMVLFLIGAALAYLYALCLRGYEAWTTHRYNVKHPCPWCHEPSEPAEYYDEDTEHGRVALPTSLRPGIYGLFHVVHPITGNEMPTLISNGRDQLLRKCPHCHEFVNFESGTEKHIGFIGMPESGKTVLMCSIIGELKRHNPDMHFTDIKENVGRDIYKSVEFYEKEGHLDDDHRPDQTKKVAKSSVQCILPRANGGLPYHLYFNDVAGELFTAGGYSKDKLRFSSDVEQIYFIIDPFTMQLNMDEVSESIKKWLNQTNVVRSNNLEDIRNTCDSLISALTDSNRDFKQINFTFVLVKSDTGYMGSINTSDPDALETFMDNDLQLSNIIHAVETRFADVNYIAVSAWRKDDKGISTLCNNMLKQLEII